jgi:beta-1,4-mannosyltransferase
MQYHAQSLAKLEQVQRVTLVGYTGEQCMEATRVEKVVEKRLHIPELGALRRVSLVHAVVKGLYILLGIFWLLMRLPSYDAVVIQNPPALPALLATFLAELCSLFYKVPAQVVVDWHNLGFTMFEEREGKRSPVAELSKHLEKYFTSWADGHFCVSERMRTWLKSKFGVEAVVLYDRPSSSFSTEPPSIAQRHALLSRLGFTREKLFGEDGGFDSRTDEGMGGVAYSVKTIQTRQDCTADPDYGIVGGEPRMLPTSESVPIIISSTSWTPDEDFGILLDGLLDLNRQLVGAGGGRKVLVVVTGKGPTKEAFLERVAELSKAPVEGGGQSKLSHIAVRAVWLEPADYPLMMRCADMGVCLHTSTSGLDLPMKVLDMFGSGMPVVAVSFPTLPELVKHGENGFIFESQQPDQLASHLFDLLSRGDPQAKYPSDKLLEMKKKAGQLSDWHSNWLQSLQKPFVDRCLQGRSIFYSSAMLSSISARLLFQVVSVYFVVSLVLLGPKFVYTLSV